MSQDKYIDRSAYDHLRFGGFHRTTNIWGEDRIVGEVPPIDTVSDVFYVPWENHGRWGIFDRAGRVVEAAVDRALPDGQLLQQVVESPVSYDNIAVKAIEGEYVYGGRFHPHFGHFLVEALPRYWQLARQPLENRKIVVHTNAHYNFFADFPFARSIFSALDLRAESFIDFQVPVRLDKLEIPHVSLRPQAFAYEAYGELCRYIGRKLLAERSIDRNDKPVWLSKTKLKHGVSVFANESIVEEYLRKHDVDIVYPEELSFEDQLDLFSSRTTIAGTTGSAFHSAVFVENNPRIIMIDPVGFKNSNFSILDKLMKIESEHYFPSGTEMIQLDGFLRAVAFPEPEAVADEILRTIRRVP